MVYKFDLSNLIRPNVSNLKPYSSARDEYNSKGEDMIFMDANENPFNTGVNRYPDPQQKKLKLELSKLKGVDPSQILLGNGSDEVLDLIFRAFCEPTVDNVITLPPTYGMYKVLANINNIEEREVLLDHEFEPQVDKILAAADLNSKVIFLCSPNNPTGNSFSADKIRRILNEFPGLVVIDEAYIDFSEGHSWLQNLKEYPNLIITKTFSKAYGMAGIRLGVIYASAEIISVLNKIKPPYNVNQLTQTEALKRIADYKRIKKEIRQILDQKSYLAQELKRINFVKKIFPSDANFILIRVDDAQKRYTEILQRGLVVRNRSNQPLCKNTLRISIGTPEENKKLLKVMLEIESGSEIGKAEKVKEEGRK